MAEVSKIHRADGVADQVTFTATVEYAHEGPKLVQFVGSRHGAPGPVYMIMEESVLNTWVVRPQRFGDTFDKAWVQKFFAS